MFSRRIRTVALLLALVSCGAGDTAGDARLLDAPAMRRLSGSWDASFEPDARSTTFAMRAMPGPVTGTIVLAVAHHGPSATKELQGITHEGAYDLDFQPFGWTTRGVNDPAVVVARLHPPVTGASDSTAADSVVLVLSPGTSRFSVEMRGILLGDSVRGTWSAASFSSGGGSGRFAMRRSGGAR